jgi:hypothetical protein
LIAHIEYMNDTGVYRCVCIGVTVHV